MIDNSEDELRSTPRVTVGLPTYNRAHLVRRSIDSVLNQTYNNIELIISDNASTDGTQSICEEYARIDPRVKYCRQESNVGPTRNINDVLKLATSEFYMWLGDDDWLAESYIETCVRELMQHPDYAVVAGIAEYISDDKPELAGEGEIMDLLSPSPGERVKKYYTIMRHNGAFYGVMRRSNAGNGFARHKILGEDWFFVAGMAFSGKIKTLRTTTIFRTLDGSSGGNWDRFFETTGYKSTTWPYLTISLSAASDVLTHNATYRSFPIWKRFALACGVFRTVYARFGLKELWEKTVVGPKVHYALSLSLNKFALGRAIKSFVRR